MQDEDKQKDSVVIEETSENNKDLSQQTDEDVSDISYDDSENTVDIIKKLKEKIKILEKEKSENLLGWQRAKADYINLKQQEEKSKKEIIKYATENFIMEIIPAIDGFTMAMGNKEAWEKVDKSWRLGVEYIYNQLLNVLKNHGITEINPLGEDFDPKTSESIENVSGGDSGKVSEVMQKGYILNGKVIKPAKVKVFE